MMKIVIKISDEDYKAIAKGYLPYGAIADAIRNGIPLPKNHGRLIDADALQTEMEKDVRKAMSFVDLKDFVWLAPTIIEGSDSE
jgi:hypothetical protein